jgi:hypothetical protein
MFRHRAAMGDARMRAFPTAGATCDHETSAIDKIPKRNTDNPPHTRELLFLAA